MAAELKQLRQRLQTLQTQRAKDEGALEQELKRIKDTFGCKDLGAARALYRKMKGDNEAAESAVEEQAEQLDDELTALEQAAAGR